MNSLVVLMTAVVCLTQSTLASGYAGAPFNGAYGHGRPIPGGGIGAGFGAYGTGIGVDGAYQGPLASPVVLPSGYLADTPEVAAARGAHLAAFAQSSTIAVGTGAGAGVYNGGLDDHLWAADGSYSRVRGIGLYSGGRFGAEAHGVGIHGAAVNGNGAHVPVAYGPGASGAGAYNTVHTYNSALVNPVVLPSGYLADTHEVAAARRAHLTAVANAASQSTTYSHGIEYHGHDYGH